MQINLLDRHIREVISAIHDAKYAIAMTGAGISVASGIPPFRGANGLWNKYDPIILELNYFYAHPKESWKNIREIFYDFFGEVEPNDAHYALAHFQETGFLNEIITQNIDNLHQKAGSGNVIEFHGSAQHLVCSQCRSSFPVKDFNLMDIPPLCPNDNKVLKPDFVFFGEEIPLKAFQNSQKAIEKADLMIIIGTSGEVVPFSLLPNRAKNNGAKIIEINPEHSVYTDTITDIYLKEKSEIVLPRIIEGLIRQI